MNWVKVIQHLKNLCTHITSIANTGAVDIRTVLIAVVPLNHVLQMTSMPALTTLYVALFLVWVYFQRTYLTPHRVNLNTILVGVLVDFLLSEIDLGQERRTLFRHVILLIHILLPIYLFLHCVQLLHLSLLIWQQQRLAIVVTEFL